MSLTPQADGRGTSGGSCAHLWQLAASHPRLSPPHVSAKFTSLYVLGSMVTVAQGTVWPLCSSTLPSTKDLTHTLPPEHLWQGLLIGGGDQRGTQNRAERPVFHGKVAPKPPRDC